jgi:hypothetical protein
MSDRLIIARVGHPSLLEALDAFYLEHRLCGELQAGVDEKRRVAGVLGPRYINPTLRRDEL